MDATRELVKTVRTAATKKARTRNGLIGGSGGGGGLFFPPPPPPPAPSTSSASSSCCSNGSRSSHRLSFTPSEAALLLATLIPLAYHSRLSTAGDGKLQSQAPIAMNGAHIASEEASTELLYPVDKIGHNEVVVLQSAVPTWEEARGSLELLLRRRRRRRECVFPLLYTWRSLICQEGPRTPERSKCLCCCGILLYKYK